MTTIETKYICNYRLWGKMSHTTVDGEKIITSFEGVAAIKNSASTTRELVKYFKEYWKKRGYEVFCLSLTNKEEETEFSCGSDNVVIQMENNSFYSIVKTDWYNNNKEEKDVFVYYETVTEIGKDGIKIVNTYKKTKCFTDEMSAIAFVEGEMKNLISEDIINFMNIKRKLKYIFNPQNKEWTYTTYSTELDNASETRIEFSVEYIGKLSI